MADWLTTLGVLLWPVVIVLITLGLVAAGKRFNRLPPDPDPSPDGMPSERTTREFDRLVLGGLVPLLGLGLLGVGGPMVWSQYRQLQDYQPVEARVLAARVASEWRDGQDDEGRPRRFQAEWPAVEYRYEVNGRSYVSDRLLPFQDSVGRRKAEEMLRPYSPGRRVTAYYNPQEPSEAFLLRRYAAAPALLCAVGICLLVIGAGFRGRWASRRHPTVR